MISECLCAWCGKLFVRPHGSGPAPQYCSIGHRQRAQERRALERAIAAAIETIQQDSSSPVASPSTINPTTTKGTT